VKPQTWGYGPLCNPLGLAKKNWKRHCTTGYRHTLMYDAVKWGSGHNRMSLACLVLAPTHKPGGAPR